MEGPTTSTFHILLGRARKPHSRSLCSYLSISSPPQRLFIVALGASQLVAAALFSQWSALLGLQRHTLALTQVGSICPLLDHS